jgi:hypothetical protein
MMRALRFVPLVFACSQAHAADAPCFTKFTDGQARANDKKFVEAVHLFTECLTDTTCPAKPLLKDCEQQRDAAAAHVGSIVVGASGTVPSGVRAEVDGHDAPYDGRAIDVDPGPHHVRLAAEKKTTLEQDVIVGEGEKLKKVVFDVGVWSEAPAPVLPVKPTETRSTSAVPFVIGGIGLVALGTFGVLAGIGQATYDDCQSHGCGAGTLDGLRVERVVAWTALGIGVVAVGTAAVLFFTGKSKHQAAFIQPAITF